MILILKDGWMNPVVSELRTLLKHADTLQDLAYERKEVERTETKKLNEAFFVKKAIIEYQYLKGLEAKSFVVFQGMVSLFMAIIFIAFLTTFREAWGAFGVSLILGLAINVWFVLGYKPYKLNDWYLTGALFYGLLLAFLGGILLAYASVVFFLDVNPFFLVLLSLLNVSALISYAVGGIFPGLYNYLDKRATENATLKQELEALDIEKRQATEAIQDKLKRFDEKMKATQAKFDAITVIPSSLKAVKVIKTLIYYFDEHKEASLDEAIAHYKTQEENALRTMEFISV